MLAVADSQDVAYLRRMQQVSGYILLYCCHDVILGGLHVGSSNILFNLTDGAEVGPAGTNTTGQGNMTHAGSKCTAELKPTGCCAFILCSVLQSA